MFVTFLRSKVHIYVRTNHNAIIRFIRNIAINEFFFREVTDGRYAERRRIYGKQVNSHSLWKNFF